MHKRCITVNYNTSYNKKICAPPELKPIADENSINYVIAPKKKNKVVKPKDKIPESLDIKSLLKEDCYVCH